MRRYMPDNLRKEEEKLIDIVLNSSLTVEETIEKYATEEYKQFRKEDEKRVEKLCKQGIIAGQGVYYG